MTMNRRAHKKSRNGCVECKRRHIKCDETQPRCRNCTIIERTCIYRTPARSPAIVSGASVDGGSDVHRSDGLSTPSRSPACSPHRDVAPKKPPHPATDPAAPAPSSASLDLPAALPRTRVNMDHMELIVNFALNLIIPELDEDLWERGTRLSLKTGLGAPYLMHEILSLSALQLAYTRPERKQHYLDQAIQLQTEGISLFNSISPDMNESNCVAISMFSSLLGRHLCIDALATRGLGLDGFLDSYLDFVHLRQRGKNVMMEAKPALDDSELRDFLRWGKPGLPDMRGEGSEYDGVLELISRAPSLDGDESAREACRQAVEMNQVAYDAWKNRGADPGMKRVLSTVFTWAFLVPEEFAQMLRQRRPEAIAVLGCHTVLLHLTRDWWHVGDAGAYLLGIITEHLGPEWSGWLEWARSIVYEDV